MKKSNVYLFAILLFLVINRGLAAPTPAIAAPALPSALQNKAETISALDACLKKATKVSLHRIEREDQTKECFNSLATKTKRSDCYLSLEKFKNRISSIKLKEDIRAICFYESLVSYKKVSDCMTDVNRFKNAYTHDDAAFYCYQQFQDSISKNDCIQTSQQMVLPAKADYLFKHCLNSYQD